MIEQIRYIVGSMRSLCDSAQEKSQQANDAALMYYLGEIKEAIIEAEIVLEKREEKVAAV